ncbi:hypothetical protein ACFC1L_39795 [Streptomyces sp. NPDC056210]|uniref:hypothetical protein n=1 Tax=Streptomyces sp. NPDC056210 TaxID=3345746 RepID=UPI0035E05309
MTAVETSEDFVATLKFGAGYDSPWLVVRDASAEGLKAKLEQAAGTGLMETVAKAANMAITLAPAKPEAPKSQPTFSNGQVQYNNGGGGNDNGPSRPDNVPAHYSYKSGNKNGKPWSGWFPPRGSDEKPIWG